MEAPCLEPIKVGTNMAPENQEKHLSLRFEKKTVKLLLREIINIQLILFFSDTRTVRIAKSTP